MDDDVTFGTSVWGSESPIAAPVPKKGEPIKEPLEEEELPAGVDEDEAVDDGFDDFDDFTDAAQASDAPATGAFDDDDFGDFGEAEEMETGPSDFQFQQPEAGPSWQPLTLDPFPSHTVLTRDVDHLLEPLWVGLDVSQVTSNEPIREKEGVSQILVTSER
jgi:hypothetical protein